VFLFIVLELNFYGICLYSFSDSLSKFYIGSCKDIDDRLEQHRFKVFSTSFTSKAEDWQVFRLISDLGYEQVRKIEGHIRIVRIGILIS